MSVAGNELSVDFADPLVAADAQDVRAFHAELKKHPELASPDLIADPEFVFVVENFYRDAARKVLYALVCKGGKPVSMFPVEIGPEKNLPGEYFSLFRHQTRLSDVGIACPQDAIEGSLSCILDAMRQRWPKVAGFSLMGLKTDSPSYAALTSLLKDCPRLEREAKLQLYIDLDEFDSIDAYYDSRGRNYKKNFRSARNRLNKMGGYTYSADGPDGPWTFEEMARIDALTWRADEKEGETPKMLLQMCERVSALAASPEKSQLCALAFEGQAISMYYSLYFGDVKFVFKNTFDPEFSHVSPSVVAFHHVVEAAIEAGARRMELMAGNAYARPWANRERFLSDDVLFFKSARGRAAHLAVTGTRALRDIVKGTPATTAKGGSGHE
ncbi:MAG: GNAT family N-acetyltransferase [Pseudomonadota bacterium]